MSEQEMIKPLATPAADTTVSKVSGDVTAKRSILLPSIKRAGRVIQFSGNLPQTFSVVGNSFYVIDSNVPVSIRTNASAQTIYPAQTGESFPFQIQNLYVLGAPALIVAKIWVGFTSFTGFIDRRAQNPITSRLYTSLLTATASGTFSLAGTTAFQTLQITQNYYSASIGWSYIVSLNFLNISATATNIVYLTDNTAAPCANGQFYAGLVPNVPQTLPVPGYVPVTGLGNLYFYNPNATSVSVVVTANWCYGDGGFGLETNP